MSAAEQLQYESGVRFRYAVIAFVAALLIVGSQVLGLAGVHAPVNELTLTLIAFSQRSTVEIVGAILDALGLISLVVALSWLLGAARARRQETRSWIRWIVLIGAALSAVAAITETFVVANKAHIFVTTGAQSYPEAYHLTNSAFISALPILLELGELLLAIGIVMTSLNLLRVGLVTRPVGYAGVAAGAFFIIPIAGIAPLVQGFWIGSLAVILAARWPSGELPAWESGEAVPWQPRQAPPQERGTRAQRRRKVSDSEVLAAVKTDAPPVPKTAGRSKRKRRR